jgi:hypothetical protein
MSMSPYGPIGAGFDETLGFDIFGLDPDDIPTPTDSTHSTESDNAEFIEFINEADVETSETSNHTKDYCSCHQCHPAINPSTINPSSDRRSTKIDQSNPTVTKSDKDDTPTRS